VRRDSRHIRICVRTCLASTHSCAHMLSHRGTRIVYIHRAQRLETRPHLRTHMPCRGTSMHTCGHPTRSLYTDIMRTGSRHAHVCTCSCGYIHAFVRVVMSCFHLHIYVHLCTLIHAPCAETGHTLTLVSCTTLCDYTRHSQRRGVGRTTTAPCIHLAVAVYTCYSHSCTHMHSCTRISYTWVMHRDPRHTLMYIRTCHARAHPCPSMYTHITITHRVCIHRVYRHDAHSHMHAHMHCLPTCMCTHSTHVAYIHHAQRPRTQNHTHMHYLPTPMHTYGHTYMRMHITIIRRDASHNLMCACAHACMHPATHPSGSTHTSMQATDESDRQRTSI
jgi:hypothetical protein